MKAHFWLGRFKSEGQLKLYFEENYGSDDFEPISYFARDQNEAFYDHDFLEFGFEEGEEHIKEKFEHYSYSKLWMEELEKRATDLDQSKINTIVFIESDEIESPKTIRSDNYFLHYVGEIKY